MVTSDPQKYIGAYIYNYSSNNENKWRISYADEDNVYIILQSYLPVSKLPEKNGIKPENTISSYPASAVLTNLESQYSGYADITDERVKRLNSKYFKYYSSASYTSCKVTAYLLDHKIWDKFSKGIGGEFAIGGPTIELAINSYNAKYSTEYACFVPVSSGYQVRDSKNSTYTTYIANMFDDSLYSLSSSDGAIAMWLSSISYASKGNGICGINSDKAIGSYSTDYNCNGFRPVVCLKSSVSLEKTTDDHYNIRDYTN